MRRASHAHTAPHRAAHSQDSSVGAPPSGSESPVGATLKPLSVKRYRARCKATVDSLDYVLTRPR